MMSTQRLAIGLKHHQTVESIELLQARAKEIMPDVEVVFVEGASFAAWQNSNDDLTVAATRMHEALYSNGAWLATAGIDVIAAFDQLQAAMKRRGWKA